MSGGSVAFSVYRREYRHLLAFIFAIDEINSSPDILPNVTLGYHVYDSCGDVNKATKDVLQILSGHSKTVPNYSCMVRGTVAGFIGDLQSDTTLQMAQFLHLYGYTQISYGARDTLLSDRKMFPNLFRTVSDNEMQYVAIVKLLKRLKWNWVGIITSDDKYGEREIQQLSKQLTNHGICIEFRIMDLRTNVSAIGGRVDHVETKMGEFAAAINMIIDSHTHLSDEVHWLKSKMADLDDRSHRNNVKIRGIPESVLQQDLRALVSTMFKEILLDLSDADLTIDRIPKPLFLQEKVPRDVLMRIHFFHVKEEILARVRSATQILEKYSKMQFFPGSVTTYPELEKEPRSHHQSAMIDLFLVELSLLQRISWLLTGVLFNFTFPLWFFPHIAGRKDTPKVPLWFFPHIAGHKDTPKGLSFSSKPLQTSSGIAPRGRCSEECLSGFRKALREGYHVCCYDCAPCSEGEISIHSDSENCQMCPEDQWPNEARNVCVAKIYEYLSYEKDIVVVFFSVSSVIFSATSLSILGMFFWFRSTPIVRANNRNLSFILLFSLMLSFLSVFLFLGHPVDITCMLQQDFFAVVFTVSLSSILAKTIMVVIAFKATRPGSSCRKWVGVKLPNTVLLFCSLIQVMIGVFWLSISPPFQEYDMHTSPGKIIIQCNEGSVIAFYSVLGYMGLLAAVSFVLAFMVRTLPDSFNEAQYITFSMLVFCSVWIAMIPAYLSTRGKYTVAVEIFAILTSSAGILVCIFFPKLYILLFKPELNTRKSIMAGRIM
ncbi:PREDICTED: vomeronasal type-2 receptor 26-like [Nanorana parkeri]|uniref:vomeronasal type-2 receptor 26-like n=1 Tax=Nanorana parkeri TaxID=125878 RepID=UPI000854950A|nr:PREDICTED: vomeronasal type-2 receptor 26-like [Nanorana parkeri]